VTPVLGLFEAAGHRHNVARSGFTDIAGTTLPSPAPRFSATPAELRQGELVEASEVLQRWTAVPA
jgi:alpha-methylacyl-CoA racemase